MRLLIYRFKCILKTKGIFAQCILFPMIVATLCYTSFERVHYGAAFKGERIAIGIVADDSFSKDIFDETRFDVYSISETVAEKYLEDGVISSYIRVDEKPELIVIKYEDEQKMTKAYLDAYLAGASPARLKGQLFAPDFEQRESSVFVSNFTKLVMAAVCTSLAGILLIASVSRNRRRIYIRNCMAAVSELQMALQDIVVVLSSLAAIFVILYGYIYFMLNV